MSEVFEPDWFSKPGDTLLAMMEQRELTLESVARMIGRPHGYLQKLLSGAVEVDEGVAERLSKAVGGTARFWLARQDEYNKSLERAATSISKFEGSDWLKQFPHTDIVNYGWVTRPAKRGDLVKTYLAYFGVANVEDWQQRYANSFGVAFRSSPSFESKQGALSAWLRQGELEAAALETKKWSSEILRSKLAELRTLTKAKSPAYFLPRMRRICAEAGIALVFVRAPSGCRASGATRFLSPDKAMVILSFRHLSDDHFWFTFFHEIAHLLLHENSETFVDGEINPGGYQETEANQFSAAVLIPPTRQTELQDLKPRTDNVVRFAYSVGVSPGIVVGQLQHIDAIKPKQLNFLKRRFRWDQITAALANP